MTIKMEFIEFRIEKMKLIQSLPTEEISSIIQTTEKDFENKLANINQYIKDSGVDLTLYHKELEYPCSKEIDKKIGFYLSPSYVSALGRYTRETDLFNYWYSMRDTFYYYDFKSIEFLKNNTIKTPKTFDFPVVKQFANGNTIYQCTAAEITALKEYISLVTALRDRFEGKRTLSVD